MGLLPHAPDDEYDIESKKIASQIIQNSDINETIKIVK